MVDFDLYFWLIAVGLPVPVLLLTGPGMCSGSSCDITVAGPLSMAAAFNPQQTLPPQHVTMRRLSLKIEGGGRVISTPAGLDCSADCAVDFPEKTAVTLTAVPVPGMLFVT